VKKYFNLTIIENENITSYTKKADISDNLSVTLNENVPPELTEIKDGSKHNKFSNDKKFIR